MRILTGLILILWSQFAAGQYYASRYFSSVSNNDTGVYSPQYQEVLTYATNNGIEQPSANVKDVQDDFMRYLVSSGIYNTLRNRKFGALYVTLGDTSLTKAFAGINWIDTSKYNGTETGGTLTLMPYVGIKSDGSSAHYDINMNFWAGDTTEFYTDFGFGGFYDKGVGSEGWLFGAETKGTSSVDQRIKFEELNASNRENIRSWIGGSATSNRLLYNLSDGGVPSPPYLLSAIRFSPDSMVSYINGFTKPSNTNSYNINTVTGQPARQGEFAFLANLVTTHATDEDTANITSKVVSEAITDTIQFAYIGANLQPYFTELDSAFRVYRGNIQALNDTINPFSQTFFPNTQLNTSLPALPRNVYAYGMQADGGSGRHKGETSNIWTVSNSNGTGAGSFLASLDSAENDGTPSIIVFSSDVMLDTSYFENITIGQDDLTVYGQTAPSGGVRLHGKQFIIRGNNIVFQHIRFSAGTDSVSGESPIYPIDYEGWTQFGERDAVSAGGDSIVFDHCTFNFGTDELAQSRGSNITYNYCLFTKPLSFYELFIDGPDTTFTGHQKKAHPKGLIILKQDSAESQNIAINRCLFIGNVDRNPQLGGQVKALVQENYIFNSEWGISAVYGQPKVDDTLNGGFPLLTAVRNQISQIIKQPFRFETKGFDTAGAVWLDSNYYDGAYFPGNIPTGYQAANAMDSLQGSNYVPIYKLKSYLSAQAGARPQLRDTVEKTAINELRRGLLVGPPRNMDFWRPLLNAQTINTHVLNIPANPNAIDSSGYKAIEVWADSLHWKVTYPDSIPWPAIEADPTGAFLWDMDSPFILPQHKENNLTAYKEEEYIC